MKSSALRSLKAKITGAFLLVTTITFILNGLITNIYVDNILSKNIQNSLQKDSLIITNHINEFFVKRATLVEQMSTNQMILDFMHNVKTRDQIKTNSNYPTLVKTLNSIKETDSSLALVWIALEEPSYILSHDEWDCPEDYVITERSWYIDTLKKKSLYYTEPYLDKITEKMVMSIVKPIYDENNKSLGVVAIDLMIDELPTIMKNYKIGTEGYPLLVSAGGDILYHPDESMVLKDKIQDLLPFGKNMIAGETGFSEYKFKGADKYIGYAPISSSGWSVCTIIGKKEVHQDNVTLRSIMIFIYTLSIFILLGVLYFIISKLLRHIPILLNSIEKFAQGDLTIQTDINTDDEIGLLAKAFNTMSDNFRILAGNILESSQKVSKTSHEFMQISEQSATASENIAQTICEIAHGASDQARATSDGSMKISQLGTIVEEDIKYMKDLSNSSEKVVILIEDGINIIHDLSLKTDKSGSAIKEVYEDILKTNESSDYIGQASQVISSIADQTNLLALNAAIEAARAGEHGRGFAIVADEIRKLAEQSTKSTEIIDKAVSELQNNSNVSVKTIESVLQLINQQVESVKVTENKYKQISEAIIESQKLIDSLNVSGNEMNKRKDEILDIMQELSAIAHENAASSQEVSATTQEQTSSMQELSSSSEDMAQMAKKLNEAVEKFKI